jgi:hypothetical protein
MGISGCVFCARGCRSCLVSKESRIITQAHLYTAINIYLLLGLLWATLYLAIDTFHPGSIQIGSRPPERETNLLYFSLITLSTIGYGDIVPLNGEAQILAALEGVTGVLYIAITVALLVSRFRIEPSDSRDRRDPEFDEPWHR